jgi:hypothetical protein
MLAWLQSTVAIRQLAGEQSKDLRNRISELTQNNPVVLTKRLPDGRFEVRNIGGGAATRRGTVRGTGAAGRGPTVPVRVSSYCVLGRPAEIPDALSTPAIGQVGCEKSFRRLGTGTAP